MIRSMKVAIYPGSFDPITFGHIDIVDRAASLFDQVVIGVAESKSKNPLFSTDERLDLINEVFSGNSKIRAIGYSKKLTVDLARENNAIAIIRGLRAVADFEYEFQMLGMNRQLDNNIETVFLMADAQRQSISSNFVKEIARLGGNISNFTNKFVEQKLKDKFK